MQQALRVDGAASSSAAGAAPAAPAGNAFVINLLSSTTPVALTRPDHAGLKRFTFFVSRRREDGRERFRLHMGYFDTQEEAEKLLDIVRSIYPGAWAGLAPGRRLSTAAPSSLAPTAAPAANAPTPTPVPPAPAGHVASAARREPAARGEPRVPREPAARGEPIAPSETVALSLVPDAGRVRLADITEQDPPRAEQGESDQRARVQGERQAAARALNSVRDTIASLEDASVGTSGIVIPTLQPPAAPALLSDTATLRLLESGTPQSAASEKPRTDKPYFAVQLMWSVQPIVLTHVPQLAIFSAYTLYGAEGNRDGRRWYGLRLGFFTDAVSAKQVAHYVRGDFATVSVVPVSEREREQAKVAVTRGASVAAKAAAPAPAAPPRATSTNAAAAPATAGAPSRSRPKNPEFAFIEDLKPAGNAAGALAFKAHGPVARAAGGSSGRSAGGVARVGPPGRPSRGAPGKRAKVRRAPGQVQASATVKPKTLEETLEILGANQLQVDDEPGVVPLLEARGSLPPGKTKASKLSQLFERLSERLVT